MSSSSSSDFVIEIITASMKFLLVGVLVQKKDLQFVIKDGKVVVSRGDELPKNYLRIRY
jgi:hypothetical protein